MSFSHNPVLVRDCVAPCVMHSHKTSSLTTPQSTRALGFFNLTGDCCVLRLQSGALARFDRLLLKVPEHTWGLDVKSTLLYFNLNSSNTHLHSCITQTLGSEDAATAFSSH